MSTPRQPVQPTSTPQVIEPKKDWRAWAKDWLKKNGFKGSEEQLNMAATDFAGRYQQAMADVTDPPRESTAPQSLTAAEDAERLRVQGNRSNVETSLALGKGLLGLRGGMGRQDRENYAANLGAHTAAVKEILGASQSDVINDQLQNRVTLAGMNNDFLSRRSDNMINTMNEMHARENTPNTMDYLNFVKDLGITAAMIFD